MNTRDRLLIPSLARDRGPNAAAHQKGFTLIELMVTLALAAVLLTVGVPSFRAFIQNNRLATQLNEFVTALNVARSEAIKRARTMTVCKSADGATCTTAGQWQQGWIVFLDVDGDGTVDAGDGDEVFRVQAALLPGFTMNAGTRHRVTYSPSGLAIGFTGTWTLCDPERKVQRARGAYLSNTGRVRLAEDTDGDGVRDNGAGTPVSLTCA